MLTRTPKQAYLAACGALKRADLRPTPARSRVPTLCLVGDQTARPRSTSCARRPDLIPGAQFEIIGGAGHIPGVEQPETVARLVASARQVGPGFLIRSAEVGTKAGENRPFRVESRESIDTAPFWKGRRGVGPGVLLHVRASLEGRRASFGLRDRGRIRRSFGRQFLDSRARIDRRRLRRHRHQPALRASDLASVPCQAVGLGRGEVIGVVSLIIWALMIIVTGKYVLFLMQADNKGEGGILSLMALAQRALGKRTTVDFLARRRRGRRCSPATRSSRRRFPCFRRSRG